MGARLKAALRAIDLEDALLVSGGLLILSAVALLLDWRWSILLLGVSLWAALIVRRR